MKNFKRGEGATFIPGATSNPDSRLAGYLESRVASRCQPLPCTSVPYLCKTSLSHWNLIFTASYDWEQAFQSWLYMATFFTIFMLWITVFYFWNSFIYSLLILTKNTSLKIASLLMPYNLLWMQFQSYLLFVQLLVKNQLFILFLFNGWTYILYTTQSSSMYKQKCTTFM